MRIVHSLSFRLALIYAGLFCLSVAVLLGLYYWISVHAPLNAVKTQVRAESEAAARTYILDGPAALRRGLEARASRTDARMAFHAFVSGDGRVVTANLPGWPRYVGNEWRRFEADIYRDGDESDHEALVMDRRFEDGARLLIGRDIEDIDDLEERLIEAAYWILLGTVLLGVLGGVLMSRAIGKRVEAINVAARTVIAGDLSGRVVTRGSGDDFDRLGETFNLMLARIEELVESVRRVSDSVAHELRTPLARLLVGLEALAGEKEEDRRSRLQREATDEARRLRRIFDALLRIARIESGRHSTDIRPVDLAELVADAAEFHQPDADAKGIRLDVRSAADLTVMGDADLLFQAASNLIDNALKYTPAGGEVAVSVERRGPEIILSVSDSGIGISAEDRERVTERFYRGEAARRFPGEGLGLSVVAAVAAQHRAGLQIGERRPGTCVQLIFPVQ